MFNIYLNFCYLCSIACTWKYQSCHIFKKHTSIHVPSTYLKDKEKRDRQAETEANQERYHLYTGSLLKWPQQQEPSWAKARRQELLSLHQAWQEPRHLSHHLLLSECPSRELNVETRHHKQHLNLLCHNSGQNRPSF